jgi:hypothetical protein
MKLPKSWLLLLRALLLALFLVSGPAYSYTLSEPFNKTALALYQYEHWDEDVAKFLQHYENKLSPKEKEIGAWVGFGIKCLLDQKIEFTIRF